MISVPQMRKRWISRNDAAVWCPAGRWGPRRTRTNECWSTLRAEDVYTGLLKDDASKVRPGAAGTATWKFEDRDHTAWWEVRHNAVWRSGRVFLKCPQCGRRCTRLYLPLKTSGLACRRCWGLTYVSRALYNYRDSLWGRGMIARMFGTTQRDWALDATSERRHARYRASLERWGARRKIR